MMNKGIICWRDAYRSEHFSLHLLMSGKTEDDEDAVTIGPNDSVFSIYLSYPCTRSYSLGREFLYGHFKRI